MLYSSYSINHNFINYNLLMTRLLLGII